MQIAATREKSLPPASELVERVVRRGSDAGTPEENGNLQIIVTSVFAKYEQKNTYVKYVNLGRWVTIKDLQACREIHNEIETMKACNDLMVPIPLYPL